MSGQEGMIISQPSTGPTIRLKQQSINMSPEGHLLQDNSWEIEVSGEDIDKVASYIEFFKAKMIAGKNHEV